MTTTRDEPGARSGPLEPVAIGVGEGRRLNIRLYGAWVADHPGASALAEVGQRLSAFCVSRYGVSTRPAAALSGQPRA